MYAKNIVSMLLCNLSFFIFCSDTKKPLIDRKDKKLEFDYQNARGFFSLMSHSADIERYPSGGWYYLCEALQHKRSDAVDYYAQRTPLVAIINELAEEGNRALLQKILPLIHKAPTFEIKYEEEELPALDYSGLQRAVWWTKSRHKKSDAHVKAIMKTIIQFYTPVHDVKCIKRCCFGKCTAQCQNRRKALIEYGCAKAASDAIEGDRWQIITWLFYERGTYVTLDAIQAARNKNNTQLAKQLTTLRLIQRCCPQADVAKSYALLRMFNCIKDAKDAGVADGRGYGPQVAQPVITNIRYGSWIGSLPCAQACPKE